MEENTAGIEIPLVSAYSADLSQAAQFELCEEKNARLIKKKQSFAL